MAIQAGEVVHIVQCIPVDCELIITKECYIELLIILQNKSFFVTTKSRILVKTANQRHFDAFFTNYVQDQRHMIKIHAETYRRYSTIISKANSHMILEVHKSRTTDVPAEKTSAT